MIKRFFSSKSLVLTLKISYNISTTDLLLTLFFESLWRLGQKIGQIFLLMGVPLFTLDDGPKANLSVIVIKRTHNKFFFNNNHLVFWSQFSEKKVLCHLHDILNFFYFLRHWRSATFGDKFSKNECFVTVLIV